MFRYRSTIGLIFWLGITMFGTGCAQLTPFIQDFNILSIPEEKQLSVRLAESVSQQMRVLTDTPAAHQVQTLGSRMVAALPRRDFDYAFFVIEDPTPNAFTIPGGKIYVHTGLLKMTSENELAGVLGHEIGHAYERHPTKSLSRAYGVEFLSQMLFRNQEPGRVKQIGAQLVKGSLLTKYGRDDEREADEISYFLLKRAGIPTEGLVNFLIKLNQLQARSAQPPAFLNSHPPTPERIQRLQTLIQNDSSGSFRPEGL